MLAAVAAGLIPAAPAVASPTGVVVDELRLRGPAGGNDEFVELRNTSAAPVSIAGYRLQGCASSSGSPSTRATVPDGVTLAPGQAYLFTNSASGGYSGSVPGDQTYATGFADFGATNASGVRIIDATGAVVDGAGSPGSAQCREGAGLTTPAANGDQAFQRTQDTDDNATDFSGPAAGAPQNRASGGGGGSGSGDPEPAPEPDAGADGACGDAATAIGTVQGPGETSPLDGQRTTVEGIVVGDFQGTEGDGSLDGFFVQSPQADDDPRTSEGLFVYDPDDSPEVREGDRVRVSGTVAEFVRRGDTETATQLTRVEVRACASGQPLPPAAVLDLPRDRDDLERNEGMRVTSPDALTVTELYGLGFGEVGLAEGGEELTVPTEVLEPGPAAAARAEENEDRQIVLDDGRGGANRDPVRYTSREDALRRGDVLVGTLEGVLTVDFDAWRVQPTRDHAFAERNPRPAAPAPVGGDVQVGNFNVLNYFVTFGRQEDRGADDAAEFARQEAKIVAAIEGLGAEIVSLQEVQDTSDEASLGNDPDAALDRLVAALNEAAGRDKWAKVPAPRPFGNTDEIRVALIYQPAAVERIGESVAFPDDAFVGLARVPVAQTFRAGLERFTVVANHFKSKGCGGATGADADQGDGQGCFNAARVAQAEAELEFVRQLQADTDDPDVLVLGDLNAYTQEDPIDVLTAGGLVDLEAGEPADERSSYVFRGQEGALDHLLATPSLAAKVTGTDVWHINSDESRAYEYEGLPELYAPDPYRSSDHDPSVLGIDTSQRPTCEGRPATIVGTPGADTLRGTNGDDVIVAFEGDDVIDAGNGRDVVCAGTGDDRVGGGNGDDVLLGGPGDDALRGENGDDVLRGGLGTDDRLDGGRGADREEQEG